MKNKMKIPIENRKVQYITNSNEIEKLFNEKIE